MASLGELKEGDGFETNASFDDQCVILVESDDTFSYEYSLDKLSIVDFSEVTPHDELIDPISNESTLDLFPTPPISPLSSPSPFFFLL